MRLIFASALVLLSALATPASAKGLLEGRGRWRRRRPLCSPSRRNRRSGGLPHRPPPSQKARTRPAADAAVQPRRSKRVSLIAPIRTADLTSRHWLAVLQFTTMLDVFLSAVFFSRCSIKLEERRRTRDVRSKEAYSITSSARRRNDSWTARPMAFAVLRLIVSSNFVGCSTGRSAGFVPCRILCTSAAPRRNM